jgi:hypothetical protein
VKSSCPSVEASRIAVVDLTVAQCVWNAVEWPCPAWSREIAAVETPDVVERAFAGDRPAVTRAGTKVVSC